MSDVIDAADAILSANPAVGVVARAASGAGFTSTHYSQVAGYGRASHLLIAIAIAMNESGGDPSAVNDKNRDGSIDRGLWQINSVHLGPRGQLAGKFTAADLLDADKNAKAAFIVGRGGANWSPWSPTFPGKVAAWLKANNIKTSYPDGTSGIEDLLAIKSGQVKGNKTSVNPVETLRAGIDGLADAAAAIADVAGVIGAAVTDVGWWKRVAIGVAGVVLLLVGFALVSNDALLPPQIKAIAELAGKMS